MLNTITNVFTSTTSEISSLLSDITAATGTVSVSSMLFALILGVVMGFLISLVYVLTHRKSGYTQSYVLTLLMLPPIGCNRSGNDKFYGKCAQPGRCIHALPLSNRTR